MDRFKYLLTYLKKYKLEIFLAVLFLILETLTGLLQPLLMARIIDRGVGQGRIDYIYKIGILMILSTLIMGIFTIIRNRYSSLVSQSFGADLREDLYIHIQGLSFKSIGEIEIASLITRVTNDVAQVQGFLHSIMRVFLKAPLTGLGSIILAFLLDVRLASIFIIISPIILFLVKKNLELSYPIYRKIQEAIDGINKSIREYLSGIRVVKAFNRYDFEREKFKQANEKYRSTNIRGQRITGIFNPLVSLIINLGIVSILYFGGWQINQGTLEIGKLIAFIDYMSQMLFSFLMMSHFFNRVLRAGNSAERIGEVFNVSGENSDSNNYGEVIDGDIVFKDVYFRYGEDMPFVLEGINIRIERGSRVGIIGSTGSGKTSLINLLPRFYEATRGDISIGGRPIKDIGVEDLRNDIGIVSQKSLLFQGTIEDNLAWARENATREEVIEVAKVVEAHRFIEGFNQGYETILGQGGVNLSGGQKQRISIGRTLITQPKILILDDSTSALDVITESKIKYNLGKTIGDRTLILIGQRISSVMDLDKIIVLDQGKVVASGNHSYLMEKSKDYQEIYRSQIGREEDINELEKT